MKTSGKILAGIAVIVMVTTGCSTQEAKQGAAEPVSEDKTALNMSKKEPPPTIFKGNKSLSLVRIMDGAVCKNDQQGAQGEFLLYADSADIDRIKRDKGDKVFSEFEHKIEAFSADVFDGVINTANMAEDPFALGEFEANQKLAEQVANNFKAAVVGEIDRFQQETTLTIDVVAFPASFTFYRKGCDINKMNMAE
jgi:hypothetical protein